MKIFAKLNQYKIARTKKKYWAFLESFFYKSMGGFRIFYSEGFRKEMTVLQILVTIQTRNSDNQTTSNTKDHFIFKKTN